MRQPALQGVRRDASAQFGGGVGFASFTAHLEGSVDGWVGEC